MEIKTWNVLNKGFDIVPDLTCTVAKYDICTILPSVVFNVTIKEINFKGLGLLKIHSIRMYVWD